MEKFAQDKKISQVVMRELGGGNKKNKVGGFRSPPPFTFVNGITRLYGRCVEKGQKTAHSV